MIDDEAAPFAFLRKNPMISEGVFFDCTSDDMEPDEKIVRKSDALLYSQTIERE